MAIKKLQNDFTTQEQSKRLLELGVPADSADCYYTDRHMTIWVRSEFDKIDWNAKVGDKYFFLPCWSAGRLIKIIGICHQPIPTEMRIATSDIIEYLLDIFDTIADGSGFDFSKLED